MTGSPGTGREKTLPSGMVTLMFTDIEGSTRLLQQMGDDLYSTLLERHHALIRRALSQCEGTEVATEGDSFFAVFTDPTRAVGAAVDIMRALAAEPWEPSVEVRVRIGLHTGSVVVGGDNYVGVDVHRAARISSAGHGGQILLSDSTAGLVRHRLPEGSSLERPETVLLAGLDQPERVAQLSVDGRSSFPPLRGAASPSRLPTQLTEFFGREEELEEGGRLLREHRLVTLTGPGGTGKTRLAIEIARKVESVFADGVFFVSLATTHDPAMIPLAILESMGLHTAPTVDPSDHLHRYLRDRTLLLVLDNLEQLPDAGTFVAKLLMETPSIRVLATSRAPLRVRGERELTVPPLPVPGDGVDDLGSYAATRLLIDRALTARPDFEVTSENRNAVLAIASRLEGLPLAIELAASRMRSLSPELILKRLDNRLLSSGPADLPERQQTIVNAIGWSYDLLDDERRILFERCSVFSGAFGLTQAEAVCGGEGVDDVLEGLVTLTENSLIQRVDDPEEPRFRMLVVIREFAYAGLTTRGDEADMARRHAETFLELAVSAEQEILTSRQGYWLNRLSIDHENLRGAVDWAIRSRESTLALNLVGALWRFWQFRGHLVDAEMRVSDALDLDGGDPRARAHALIAKGGIRYWRGDWQATRHPYSEALEILREHGEDLEIADALYNVSFAIGYLGDTDKAETQLREALEIYERLGDRTGVGRTYWGLANNEAYKKDWNAMLEYIDQARSALEGVDAPFDLGWTWFMGGWGSVKVGDQDEAFQRTTRALEIFADVRDLSGLTLVFDSMALVAVHAGDRVGAARLHGASHGLKMRTGIAISDVDINRYPELDELDSDRDKVVAAAYAEGSGLSVDEAIEYARRMG